MYNGLSELYKSKAELAKTQNDLAKANGNIMDLHNNIFKEAFNEVKMENLQKEVTELKEQVAEYEKLLSKPMHEIANNKLGRDFKKVYIEQQKFISNWMVSQKAFKELAIQYGEELDKTREEVIVEANKQKIFVIENLTNPENETNMGDLKDNKEFKDAAIENAKNTLREAQENLKKSKLR